MATKVAVVAAASKARARRRAPTQLQMFAEPGGPDFDPDAAPDAGSDEWYTPRWLLAWLPLIDLDPCWCSASSVRAALTYDLRRGQDGLALPWAGVVWCNPPYSECRRWVAHAYRAGRSGTIAAVVLLIPASVGDTFWHEMIWGQDAVVGFLRGRVPFDTAAGPGKATGLGGSALVIFGPDRLAVHAEIAAKSATHKRRPAWVQVK